MGYVVSSLTEENFFSPDCALWCFGFMPARREPSTEPPRMTHSIERHRFTNRSTAGAWREYAAHRQHVMNHLAATRATGNLVVLGAGNCNDLELKSLTAQFSSITLVDWDEESLVAGVQRQQIPNSSLRLRAPINFAGLWEDDIPHPLPEVAMRARERVTLIGAAPYDCVVSSCVMSQILLSLFERIGHSHSRCLELLQFERALHFHLLCDLVRPGGQVLLISDLVSTDTAPELANTCAERLPELMLELVSAHNFFTGMNPYLIAHWLQTDPTITARTTNVKLLPPWIWHVSASRAFLVFALHFTRA